MGKSIQFLSWNAPYNAGEIAVLEDRKADLLVSKGCAIYTPSEPEKINESPKIKKGKS